MPRTRRIPGLILAALLAMARPAGAAVDALVVGIDDYRLPQRDLQGAVNDANDLETALLKFGARRVIALRNSEATRGTLTQAWRRLVAEADAGDTLVFTFSGHGSQEPARVPGGERDGKDEVLILGGFTASGPGTRERLIDDELAGWFAEATAKGARVVVLIDSCHSGTMMRGGDIAGYRLAEDYAIGGDELASQITVPVPNEENLSGVTYIGAGQDDEIVPEVRIVDGSSKTEIRGALSYAFARALREAAQRDGTLQRGAMQRQIVETVRAYADGRQTPSFRPSTNDYQQIVLASPMAVSTPLPLQARIRLALAVRHADHATMAALRRIEDIDLVAGTENAGLVWDARCNALLSPAGDWSAGATSDQLGDYLDKWRLVEFVRQRLGPSPLVVRMSPDDRRHLFETRAVLSITGLGQKYLTVFSVAADGTVAFHYPLATYQDSLAVDPAVGLQLNLRVKPPGGEDQHIAIASLEPLGLLHGVLADNAGRPAARAVLAALEHELDNGAAVQLGVLGVFTGEEVTCR